MKSSLALLPLLLLGAAAFARLPQDTPKPPAAPQGAPPQGGPPREGRDHHKEVDTPLAQQMEQIEHAEHFLRRSIGDAAQDVESLKQIAAAQQAILTAKLLQPKMTASLPEAEQAKFLSGFRHEIAGLLIEFTNLERALLDGDRDAAKAAYKKLHDMEESGHSEFTEGE